MDEQFKIGIWWMYRGEDRSRWHAWKDGVHIVWNWITDDFGDLVRTD